MKKIELTNFQCHKSLVIDLEPGLNIIVGPSDTGKSSVYRALHWLAFNRPTSTASWIRHGSKEMSVEVDGIKRWRSKKKNLYIMDGEEFEAIGKEVPEPVQERLQLMPINFQGQHDSAFLFSETAGEVGRYLNRLVDLTAIDRVLVGLNSRQREIHRDTATEEAEVARLKSELEKYQPLPEMEERLEAAAEVQREGESLAQKAQKLKSQIEAARGLQTILSRLEDLPEIRTQLRAGIRLSEGIEKGMEEQKTLRSVIERAERARERISELSPLQKAVESLQSIEKAREDLDTRKQRVAKLRQAIASIQTAQEDMEEDREVVQNLRKKLDDEIGEVCPLCDQPIDQ